MRHYATACREAQVPILYASMVRHCRPFVLHILAWDFSPIGMKISSDALVEFTPRWRFLGRHPDYAPDRLPGPPRRPVDEVVTMRWRFYADVLEATGEPLCCIDGDIHWFSSPGPMFAEIEGRQDVRPFAVSPHRIPPASAGLPGVTVETHGKYGRFNCGISVWRERAPLLEMAELNRQWSYTEVVPRGPGRRPLFGDQAHIEDLAERHGAHVIQHPGVNLAPWNVHGCRLMGRSGMILVDHPPAFDAAPVIAYHYSSLRLNAFDGSLRQYADPAYEVERAPGAVELLYESYLAALRAG